MNYNYKILILKGWRDQDVKDEKFLYRYFYKKCKEAERAEFIKADEFFEGCFRQIERFEATILKDLGNNEPINERFLNFYNDRWLVGEYHFKLYSDNINSIKEALQTAYSILLEEHKNETSSKSINQPSKAEKVLLTPEKLKFELDKIKSSENQFWKGLPMDIVISHFAVMTTTKNKNGDFYLTSEQLISFLRKGFLNDTTQPKQKINCSNGEKGFVIKRFYELFDISVAQYGHIQKKEKFIKLFTDCFDNWDENSIKSFFKPGKTINKW